MKTILIVLLILVCFGNCRESKEAIDFTMLPETEFNATPFQLPAGVPDSLKQAHDSCMGFTFDVNALFLQTRDTFGIGSIVNRRSLKVVNTLGDLGLNQAQMISQFNVITNPCYEKRVLQLPLTHLLGDTFRLAVPGAAPALNKELNDAIAASDNAEMHTGSWVYLDIRGALMTILDTTQSKDGLRYKQNLLDTANMVLTATENITDISFIITTRQNMSQLLLALLQTKPAILRSNPQTSLSLYYISDNKFELTLNGFFPVVGQFVKAALQ